MNHLILYLETLYRFNNLNIHLLLGLNWILLDFKCFILVYYMKYCVILFRLL